MTTLIFPKSLAKRFLMLKLKWSEYNGLIFKKKKRKKEYNGLFGLAILRNFFCSANWNILKAQVILQNFTGFCYIKK